MEPVVAVVAVVLGPFHEESEELKFDMEIVELENAAYIHLHLVAQHEIGLFLRHFFDNFQDSSCMEAQTDSQFNNPCTTNSQE